jgi:hypothetical protein
MRFLNGRVDYPARCLPDFRSDTVSFDKRNPGCIRYVQGAVTVYGDPIFSSHDSTFLFFIG